MRTKNEFEEMGFIISELDGGAIRASKLYKNENGEINLIGANAKTLPTLRKRLEELVMQNPDIFK